MRTVCVVPVRVELYICIVFDMKQRETNVIRRLCKTGVFFVFIATGYVYMHMYEMREEDSTEPMWILCVRPGEILQQTEESRGAGFRFSTIRETVDAQPRTRARVAVA